MRIVINEARTRLRHESRLISLDTTPFDEPEPLEVIPWPLNRIDELLARPDFSESRSISALLLAQRWLAEQQD